MHIESRNSFDFMLHFYDYRMMEVVADVHRAVAASVQKCLLRVNAEEAEARYRGTVQHAFL